MRSDRFDPRDYLLPDLVFLQVPAQDMLRHRVLPPQMIELLIVTQVSFNDWNHKPMGCSKTWTTLKSERAWPGLVGPGPQNTCTPLGSSGDVFSLIALRSLFDLELDHLAFVQCLVSLHLYGGEVNEHVFARLALDEPITFRCVKPLHYTLFSAHLLDSSFMSGRYLPGVTPVGGRRKPIVSSH